LALWLGTDWGVIGITYRHDFCVGASCDTTLAMICFLWALISYHPSANKRPLLPDTSVFEGESVGITIRQTTLTAPYSRLIRASSVCRAFAALCR
jgi:hypothetical protein